MIIPISTDAPIYHRPYGTVGLIVLNVAVFSLLLAQPEQFDHLALSYGHGLTPFTWLTSNFVHGGWLHLIGNMIFLWGFGLIVEGKLGWQRFLLVFLAIGMIECAVEQLIFWRSSGASCGASAAIFGLMAICLLWAPRNELTVAYWFVTRPGLLDISILWFAVLTFAKSALLFGFLPSAGNEALHLLGAAVGAVIGLALLKLRQVDCEGWDLLSVISGTVPSGEASYSWQYQADSQRRKKARAVRKKKPAASSGEIPVPASSSVDRFSELVVQDKPHAAYAELLKIRRRQPEFQPGGDELLTLARGLRKRREWASATEAYSELIQHNPRAHAARIELAEIMVLVQERPSAARKLLAECPAAELSAQQTSRVSQIQTQIDALIDNGVIEVEGRSW
ncbi:rhomboid family intramembrane serine protease [Planctomicrobium piriforme]|uniref:Membrane associated serine protease, rhomboid family n=1 Tax=Planctomicrobium piriforme TaxID=1576369 RepID=A0A1I3LQ68_9PLAN|nr:rhomboid family intramembrane serine protease [Planctomicrobium piriforme]SFI86655.1 Membrane associated serine protease, rhomboid family [Planctomicrobium piriforme]